MVIAYLSIQETGTLQLQSPNALDRSWMPCMKVKYGDVYRRAYIII